MDKEHTDLLDILDMEVYDINDEQTTIRELLKCLTPEEKAELKDML